MTRSHFDNISKHPFGRFNAMPRSLDGYLTIMSRWNILIDLDVTSRPLLHIVNSDSPRADDTTHVHLGRIEYFGLCPNGSPAAKCFRRLVVAASTITVCSRWLLVAAATTSIRCATTSIRCGISSTSISRANLHSSTVVWQVGVRRTRTPSTTAASLVVDQHVDGL
jgi:hypothetical protein